MKFKINIPYNRKNAEVKEGEKVLSNSELTDNYINFAIRAKYPKGANGLELRAVGRIQDKLVDAIDNNDDYVVFDDSEVEILKDVLVKKEIDFPTEIARHVVKFLDAFEDALEKEKSKKKDK